MQALERHAPTCVMEIPVKHVALFQISSITFCSITLGSNQLVKKNNNSRNMVRMSISLTRDELAKIRAKAKERAGGNVSAYVRAVAG